MSRGRKRVKVDEAGVVAKYEEGQSIRNVAAFYRVGPTTIFFILKKHNANIRTKSDAQNNYLKDNQPQRKPIKLEGF